MNFLKRPYRESPTNETTQPHSPDRTGLLHRLHQADPMGQSQCTTCHGDVSPALHTQTQHTKQKPYSQFITLGLGHDSVTEEPPYPLDGALQRIEGGEGKFARLVGRFAEETVGRVDQPRDTAIGARRLDAGSGEGRFGDKGKREIVARCTRRRVVISCKTVPCKTESVLLSERYIEYAGQTWMLVTRHLLISLSTL